MKSFFIMLALLLAAKGNASTIDFYKDCEGAAKNCVELNFNGNVRSAENVNLTVEESDLLSVKLVQSNLSSYPTLEIKLSAEKGQQMREITSSLINKNLYIVVNKNIVSNPFVAAAVGPELAISLNSGSEELFKKYLSWLYEKAYLTTEKIEQDNNISLLLIAGVCIAVTALLGFLKLKKII